MRIPRLSNDFPPQKFGRYLLVEPLAQGGMAEIFLAIQLSDGIGGRVVALKKVQGSHVKDEHFAKMFQSEARLAMRLNHPNIAQSYDFGEEGGQNFISMEYVSGVNLTHVLRKLESTQGMVPMDFALSIALEVAGALHYAHSLVDTVSGIPLGIVHRDISPSNILVSYDGLIKVIDFGVAKAATNLERTKTGLIKGKPAYLSPEQIEGQELDGRSDVFALGIVLWETLTRRRLYASKDDLSTLRKILLEDPLPPSAVNAAIPSCVDEVVLKALARERENRFADANEFQKAIRGCLDSFGVQTLLPADLTSWVHGLFSEEYEIEAELLRRVHEKISKEGSGPPAMKVELEVPPFVELFKKTPVERPGRLKPAPLPPGLRGRGPQGALARSGSPLGSWISVGLLALGGWLAWDHYSVHYGVQDSVQSPVPEKIPSVAKSVVPEPSAAPLPDVAVLVKSSPKPERRIGARHEIRLSLSWSPRFRPEIKVNGVTLPEGQHSVTVSADEPVRIDARGGGAKPFSKELRIKEGDLRGAEEWLEDLKLQPL